MAAQYENLSSDLIWQISRTLPTRNKQITWRETEMLVKEVEWIYDRKLLCYGACVAQLEDGRPDI